MGHSIVMGMTSSLEAGWVNLNGVVRTLPTSRQNTPTSPFQVGGWFRRSHHPLKSLTRNFNDENGSASDHRDKSDKIAEESNLRV